MDNAEIITEILGCKCERNCQRTSNLYCEVIYTATVYSDIRTSQNGYCVLLYSVCQLAQLALLHGLHVRKHIPLHTEAQDLGASYTGALP